MEKKIIIMKWSNRNTHILNEPIYKKKWATFYGDYKQIQNYMVGTNHDEGFWNMPSTNKIMFV
jgi:hypothetical protein